MSTKKRPINKQSGVTLIELIVFIVIVSAAIAGVLKVLEVTSKNSADPMIQKQALAIAESLLVEIEQQPFTYCDSSDANASTATASTGCATHSQDNGGGTLGPIPNTESRYSNTDPFDNVADYNGFTMPDANCAGICHPGGNGTGTVIDPNLTGYNATVAISRIGGTGSFGSFTSDAVLKILITVTGPANTTVQLAGYKVRYAPN